jgi:RNA polymerase sigma-70 factor (ECF subfamily)
MSEFDQLYRTHAQAVFRFALGVAGRRDLAEDFTADAFLALHKNLDRIDATLLPAWLFTVVRNRARDHWRRQMVEQRYMHALQQAGEPTAPPTSFERWILDCPDLKPVHRSCLMLRYVYDLTRAEIAERTGLSETQVKSALQYALELLRKTYVKAEVL